MHTGTPAAAVAVDGRDLAGASFGPATGRPVLFIAGAATSKLMTFGEEHLEQRNVRLLTMDRAGIGDSTPNPARTLESTAADYCRFVEVVLGADHPPVPVVANSQGSVFGLALAETQKIDRLLLVSPADEVAFPATYAMLPPQMTSLVDSASQTPEAAAEVFRAFSPAAMEDLVLAGAHEADRALYATPAFRTMYRRALEEGFANRAAGYVRDSLIAMRPWELDLDRITIPVHIMFGVNDRSHSPDLGATLTSRIPPATRELFANAGGALLWTHAGSVLQACFR